MMENDKLIYELVQRNVEFAGSQLSERLWFNNTTLTDVLYDNLYKLLGGKFEESDFVEWTAQELIKRGCVYKDTSEVGSETPKQQSDSQEVVFELDSSEYEDLVQKIYQAVELLKASKLSIFKLFSDVDNRIRELGETSSSKVQVSKELLV